MKQKQKKNDSDFQHTAEVEPAVSEEKTSKLKSFLGFRYWRDGDTGVIRGSFFTGRWFPFFQTNVTWALLPKGRHWEERVVTERAKGLVSFSEVQTQLGDTMEDGNALFLENTEVRWGKTVRYYIFKELPITDIRYIFGRLTIWLKPTPTRKQTEYLMTLQQQHADQKAQDLLESEKNKPNSVEH